MLNLQVFVIFSVILQLNATILFWSNKHIQVPSLKFFGEEDFEDLLTELNNPQIIAFQNDFNTTNNIPRKVKNFHSTYVPNGNMYIENVTEFTEDIDDNLKIMENTLGLYADNDSMKNMLIIVSSPNIRAKRDVNETKASVIDSQDKSNKPVLYYNSDMGSGIAMIYSSKPLLLKTNSENYTLSTKKATLLISGSYSILIVTFPFPKISFTLRFKFHNSWGYWTLPSVEVSVDAKIYYLNSSKTIRAENNYSYHCFGETIFKGNNMDLVLYDMQAQPYAKKRKFRDAYDCVPFTTVPIWSGLMVSFTLILGLFLGFGALASIKTMDKFDTSKTKQLSFTVTE